jgi:glycosyltransferase involved in cell wall biosynthesis
MGYRVAMVGACPYPAPQGSQVFLRDTALGLCARGHDVRLVVYGYGVGEDASGLPVHRSGRIPGARKTAAGPSFAKPLLDAALVRALRRVVRVHAIDIVHAHNYEGLLVALAARTRPIVYHAHNAMGDELAYFSPGTLRRAAAACGAWLDRTFPRRADHVIAPHQALADYLIRCGCEPSRLSVIPPPMDVNVFDVCCVTEARPPVVYAGNLDAYQNLGLLLEAMKRIREVFPDTRLIIATADPRPVPGAERVTTTGFAGLRAVLAADGVFACPRVSWSGYPIKLLNAMAAGMAIVACRGAAHPVTHEHDGLVAPDNDDAFAEALLRLLRDPALRRRLGAHARDTVARAHNPDHIAARTERIYASLLGESQTWNRE